MNVHKNENAIELLKKDATWYKGNLHMHTTRSDGRRSPREAAAIYQAAGYDFISITDHWTFGEGGWLDGMLILSGCEWNVGDNVRHPVFHIVGVGMDADNGRTYQEWVEPQVLIDAITASGGAAILAHPAWSVADPAECMQLKGLCGAEIYNTISGMPWNSRPDSGIYFDIWATRGKFLNCMAADDSHRYDGEQGRSYMMVNAERLDRESILLAIAGGHFYASQGPVFHRITLVGGKLEVECSEAEAIVFNSNTVGCDDRVALGPIEAASYTIKPTDRFVRIELIDSEKNRAWSSPFPVNTDLFPAEGGMQHVAK